MISAKVSFVVILLVWFSVSSNCQCPARDCDVTSWTFWSRCTSDQCGQLGAQSPSRMIVTRPTCGGRECPDNLFETRQCYGGNPVDCELSEWTSWSSCTTPCGASGTQSSSRHRVLTEKCGGTCSSSLSRTRSCLQTSCFNGGSVQNGACRCRDGFTGNCCQDADEDEETDTSSFSVTLGVSLSGGCCLFFCLWGYFCHRCFCKN